MHYYLYEIKNKINGKIYVGVHKTKVLDDGYMGSGKVIKRAIEKHGIENFTKTVLETFDSMEAMFAREKEVVNEEFLSRNDVYNLRRGGFGGFDHLNKTGLNNSSKTKEQLLRGGLKTKHKWENDSYFSKTQKKIISETLKDEYASGKRSAGGCAGDSTIRAEMVRRSQYPEAIEKRKLTYKNIGHQQGESHSQFGTMWITNGIDNKKIKKCDQIPEGWNKGRIVKKKIEFFAPR